MRPTFSLRCPLRRVKGPVPLARKRKRPFDPTFKAGRRSANVGLAESSGLDTCRTLSFCPNPSRSRCVGWRCSLARVDAGGGPLRKRRRSLAEIYDSGDTVSTVARHHGLTPQQLFGWRREAQRRASRAANDAGAGHGATFAPVVVEEALPSLEAPVAPMEGGGPS